VTNDAPSPTVSGIAIAPGLLAALRPGAKLRRTIGDMTPAPWTELWHVRAIVDGEQVVYRVWSRSRRHWVYHLNSLVFLHLCWKSGTLEEA